MAEAWTDLADSDLAQDKPMRQSIARALRDNPQGIAAGVSGAPKIQTAGLATGERMTPANVRAAYAGMDGAPIGSYVFAFAISGITANGTISGSSLRRAVLDNDGIVDTGAALTGTWRNMGHTTTTVFSDNRTTLWHRIA